MSEPEFQSAEAEAWRAAHDPREVMRELHHRVSNHLQILASLIGLQARAHALPEVREALLEARRRILAVAADAPGARQAGG